MENNDPQNRVQGVENEAGRLAANAFQKDSEKPVPTGLPSKKKLAAHKRLAAWHRNLTNKQKIILLVAVILLVAGACYLTYAILRDSEKPSGNLAVTQPTTVPSKLTGLPVAPEVNEKQVTAVMIENSPAARPQSGLLEAGLVFEAIAEGGITRFMTLYQDTSAKHIGPVRSVRPYYLDIAASFDAAVAHVGGSPEGLARLRTMKLKDLDQFQNPGAYERVNTKAAPHNVYTSSAKLESLGKQKKFSKPEFTGFDHLRKDRKAETATAKTINLNISSPLYNVRYNYHVESNSYKRFMGGAAHKDEKSGKQLSPKAVIAVETTRGQNGVYSIYGMTGKGKVRIYQNGTVRTGSWSRSGAKSPYVFKDAEGKVIKIVPGQAWMTLVTAGGVSHAP